MFYLQLYYLSLLLCLLRISLPRYNIQYEINNKQRKKAISRPNWKYIEWHLWSDQTLDAIDTKLFVFLFFPLLTNTYLVI